MQLNEVTWSIHLCIIPPRSRNPTSSHLLLPNHNPLQTGIGKQTRSRVRELFGTNIFVCTSAQPVFQISNKQEITAEIQTPLYEQLESPFAQTVKIIHDPRMLCWTDHNKTCTIPEHFASLTFTQTLVLQKKKSANLFPDWLTPTTSMFLSHNLPTPSPIPVTQNLGSSHSHPLQSLNKSAFGFISVPCLNSFIWGDKNPNSSATLSLPSKSNYYSYFIVITSLLFFVSSYPTYAFLNTVFWTLFILK